MKLIGVMDRETIAMKTAKQQNYDDRAGDNRRAGVSAFLATCRPYTGELLRVVDSKQPGAAAFNDFVVRHEHATTRR